MKKILVLVMLMLMASLCFAAKVADIDFVNSKNLVNADSLTFARNSVAFKRDGTSVNANVLRTDSIAVASPVECTTVTKWPIACTADYIWAINLKTLYRSKNGTDWTAVYTFAAVPSSGFVTSAGTLLVSINVTGFDVGGTLYRYANGTFTEVIDNTQLTNGTSSAPWSFTECNGMVFVSEYGSMGEDNARCIFMSRDDGLTWTKIHNPDHVTGRHLHKIVGCSENGITTLYACYGDSTARAMFKIVDNGTSTWTATEVTQPYNAVQPTAGIWLPEQSKILFGQDASAPALFTVDSTGTFTPVYTINVNHTSLLQKTVNVFKVVKYGNIYLAAASVQSGQNNYWCGIFASLDTQKWTKLISINNTWLNIVGMDSFGRVWCNIAGDDWNGGGFYFNLPNVENIAGGLIERNANQIISVTVPTAGSGALGGASGTTVAAETGAGLQWDGSSCKWSSDATITASKFIRFSNVIGADLNIGDTLICTFWIKGHIGDGAGNNKGKDKLARVKVLAQTSDGWTEKDSAYQFITPNDNLWQKVICKIPVTTAIGSATSRAIILLYVDAAANPEDADFVVYIDGVSAEKIISPTEYNTQGTARLHDVLSYQPTSFPAAFTDVFSVATRYGTYEMGTPASSADAVSYIYLRSYAVDADNFFAVVFDTYDKKIKLINEVATESTVVATLTSSAVYLNRDEVISLGVTRSGTTVNIYGYIGGTYYTASGTITNHTIATSYWGSHPSGTQGGSLVFLRDVMYDEVLTDVQDYMEYPALPDTRDIGGQRGWLSNF